MWAVVEIKNKQYKVKKGDIISVERLKEEGKVIFDKVLLVSGDKKVEIGTPYIADFKVNAEVIEEKKSEKIIVYKDKRRKKYRRKRGHRQILTLLKISDIVKSKK
ncbi:MAG: 50S ribosomal protein L21 [Candidatus Omnitrophota bacterium]